MKKSELSNINISDEQVLITPEQLKEKLPLSEKARKFIQDSRETIATLFIRKIIVYLSYVGLALFMM